MFGVAAGVLPTGGAGNIGAHNESGGPAALGIDPGQIVLAQALVPMNQPQTAPGIPAGTGSAPSDGLFRSAPKPNAAQSCRSKRNYWWAHVFGILLISTWASHYQ